jgi:hypothetical protein
VVVFVSGGRVIVNLSLIVWVRPESGPRSQKLGVFLGVFLGTFLSEVVHYERAAAKGLGKLRKVLIMRISRLLRQAAALGVVSLALTAGPMQAQITTTTAAPISVTQNPSTPLTPLTYTTLSGACLQAMNAATLPLNYYVSYNGAIVQTIPVPGPPYSTSTPAVHPAPGTPGSYTVTVGSQVDVLIPGCTGAFVVASDGTVPIVDARVGAVAAIALGGGFLMLRRRRQALAASQA